ncbi:MAG: helix-turn-helix domain-containing protein [Candidatus Heimdallarchaeota archaeon]|nr:helix-turn-helix domain-containing protein [Candidatus Heimdallarchaeota archaeon]
MDIQYFSEVTRNPKSVMFLIFSANMHLEKMDLHTRSFWIKRVFIILLLGILFININYSNSVYASPSNSSLNLAQLVAHSSINIVGDSEFHEIASTEMWPGKGIEDDPYLIQNYQFTGFGSDNNPLIRIRDSTVYFIIESNSFNITEGKIQSTIVLINLVNGVIFNNIIAGGITGIYYQSSGYTDFSSPLPKLLIQSNVITKQYSVDDRITGIAIDINGFGVEVRDNFITESDQGIRISGSDNKITRNLIEDTGLHNQNLSFQRYSGTGISIFSGSGNIIQFNTIINSSGYGLLTISPFDVTTISAGLSFVTYTVISFNNFITNKLSVDSQPTSSQAVDGFLLNQTFDYFVIGSDLISSFSLNYWSESTVDEDNDGTLDLPYIISGDQNSTDASAVSFPYAYNESPVIDNELSEDNLLENIKKFILSPQGIILTLLSLGGVGYYFIKPLMLKKSVGLTLNGKQKDIVKEIFRSQTNLYFLLMGQHSIPDKKIDREIRNGIPNNLLNYKFLLHPVRLSITKLLYENMEMTSSQIREIVDITWNDYSTHIKALRGKKYIRVTDKFVDGSKKQVVSLEPFGVQEYKILTELLHLFLDNTSDFSAYLEKIKDIKDQNLYPE